MYKAAIGLLVGLMLSVSGSAWGATTFKDGVISSSEDRVLSSDDEDKLCFKAMDGESWSVKPQNSKFVTEAKKRKLPCTCILFSYGSKCSSELSKLSNQQLCSSEYSNFHYVEEAKRRGLNCDMNAKVSPVRFAINFESSSGDVLKASQDGSEIFIGMNNKWFEEIISSLKSNEFKRAEFSIKTHKDKCYEEGAYGGDVLPSGIVFSSRIMPSITTIDGITGLYFNNVSSQLARLNEQVKNTEPFISAYIRLPNGDWTCHRFPMKNGNGLIKGKIEGENLIAILTESAAQSLREKSEKMICMRAKKGKSWNSSKAAEKFVTEAKRRGLTCGIVKTAELNSSEELGNESGKAEDFDFADIEKHSKLCKNAKTGNPYNATWKLSAIDEIKKVKSLDLYCWVYRRNSSQALSVLEDETVCELAIEKERSGKTVWSDYPEWAEFITEAKTRGLTCNVANSASSQIASAGIANSNSVIANQNDLTICARAVVNQSWDRNYDTFVKEAASRGISCDIAEPNPFGNASRIDSTVIASSADLDAANKKALQLEQELAALKAQQEQQQQNIATDGQPPVLTAQANINGSMALIFGSAADNVGVAELLIDGLPVQLSSDGSFETSLYVPRNGKQVAVTVFDLKGNQTDKTLSLQRSAIQQASGPVFDSLNPSGKRVMPNNDALALIIGVTDYERTPAKAAYADKDAKTFYDYAMLKLGIPASNIKELVNDSASEIDVRLAVKDWIARSTKQNASDIYVFFAGHGLANQSGEEMYLLPYDGEPRLLEDSAIKRNRLFDDIASANPRSVTVFLDTCYSGTTRGTDMLIASRPIAIKALKQSVPDGFTVMTAAAGDQTAKPLEEAKHGMFSYFLMKGMEGEADANQDNRITAGELHSYVQTNVIQQSSGSQTPELQGDADRVLVQFQ